MRIDPVFIPPLLPPPVRGKGPTCEACASLHRIVHAAFDRAELCRDFPRRTFADYLEYQNLRDQDLSIFGRFLGEPALADRNNPRHRRAADVLAPLDSLAHQPSPGSAAPKLGDIPALAGSTSGIQARAAAAYSISVSITGGIFDVLG